MVWRRAVPLEAGIYTSQDNRIVTTDGHPPVLHPINRTGRKADEKMERKRKALPLRDLNTNQLKRQHGFKLPQCTFGSIQLLNDFEFTMALFCS